MAIYNDFQSCSTVPSYADVGQSLVITNQPTDGDRYTKWYRVEVDAIDGSKEQVAVTWSVGTGQAPASSFSCY
jgi:hypothetical protein